jgi:hypothetical protein
VFIGHFALGFASKKAAPRVSLGTLFLAAQFADLLWPVLLLAGVERVEIRPGATPVNPFVFSSYPYSHSLVALTVWGLIFATAHRALRRAPARVSLLLAALVVSHWVLDYATHLPDVPIGFSGPFVGLGLWRSRAATIVVETVLYFAGVAIYARATEARDRTGTVALRALVLFLLVFYFGSLFAPPPPSVTALAWGTLSMGLVIAWAYWVDSHRQPRGCIEPGRRVAVAGAGSGAGSA